MSSVTEAQIPMKADAKNGLVPYLNLEGAVAAADFYKKAFGAVVAAQQPVDDKGRSMHIHLYINGSSLMLGDFYPEHGHGKQDPQAFSLALMVDDIEKVFQRAVDAGCEVTTPVQKMFWGDTYAAVKDPYGVHWAMNQAG
jgi:uncharacterized glyoxalase superfamily protein PhnB